MINQFFLYDLLYTSFSSFKTEYIYEKQYKSDFLRVCHYWTLEKVHNKEVWLCSSKYLFYAFIF